MMKNAKSHPVTKKVAAAALLFFAILIPLRASLLAYEGFGYASPTNLVGLNGGAGWNGGWVDVAGGGAVTVNSGNVRAGANAPSGYDPRSTGNSAFVNNDNRYGRLMDCSLSGTFGSHGYIDGNGHIGTPGKMLYVSFLQQAGTTVGGAFYEFEFHRGNLGDPGRIGGIGNDTGVANSINLRAPNSVNNLSLGVTTTAVNFYVLKIIYNASGLDDIYVYRNPKGLTESANTPTLAARAQADMSFDGLSIAAYNSGATVANDQIRLGESWADVVGGPPGFIVQPQSFAANVGASDTLTAVALSDQSVNYQWYQETSLLSGATNDTLALTNIALSNGGGYWVAASNSLGSVTSVVATVKVLMNADHLLAYEGFNYPAGTNLLPVNLVALNGGLGWSNGWVDVNGNGGATVSIGNLTSGTSAPEGYDARSAGNSAFVSNNNRYGRWLNCSTNGAFATFGLLDTNGNLGADGTTVYVSFLQEPGSTSPFYEFEFHRGDLGEAGRIAGIGNGFNSTTVNLRAPNAIQTPIGPGTTNVNFCVVRIDFQPGNDDVYVYRNPTGSAETDNQPTLTMLGVTDMSFNGISLAAFTNSMGGKYDEIRVGLAWSDVLGGPPAFVLQPASQNLYIGQTAVFNALAESELPVSYQWFDGANLLIGETNASLTLANLEAATAGQYWLVASNALGMATSSAASLETQPPTVAILVPNETIVPGSNLVVAANYYGPPPVSFQWYKDGALLAGATNETFSMSSPNNFDAGQYILVASGANGSVTSAVVSVYANLGGILAYEGFAYPLGGGDLMGQNDGIGWSGVWQNVDGSATLTSGSIIAGSLLAGTNGPLGYDTHSLGNAAYQPNGSRSGCFLDCSSTGNFALHGYVDTNGNIGANGQTLYVSFLQQPNTTGQFYEFEFHRGDLGDAGRIAGIGNDVGDAHVHWRVESPAGGTSTFSDLGQGSTNVNFYVVRIDYLNGNDNIRVYRNPTGTSEAANVPVVALTGVGDMSFNGISFGAYLNNLTVAHDEVRLGVTWSDVVGGTVSSLQLTQRINNNSKLRLAASPNNAYNLQATGAVTGAWTNIGTVVVSAAGTQNFVESNTVASPRFYRAAATATLPLPNIVLADFDESTYGTWVASGTAFGSGPAPGTLPNQNPVSGYDGSGLVDSFYGGDASTGTLTSPAFTITKHYLNFLIGGGNHPGQECVNLLVNGVVACTATGANSEVLIPAQWNVSAWQGQTAVLQIVDSFTGSWGHIDIDQIVLTDTPFPIISRQLVLTDTLLNLPAKNGATMRRATVWVGGNPVRDFNIKLADATPDWWAFVDVSAYQGQAATVTISNLPPNSTGLSSIVQSNGIVGATNLYSETLRPQIHYSTRRGWLNDANGMIYYHGQYHLYYQLDPFNWDGSGQKFWGHATSPDMIHWQELPVAIYSHTYGDDAWSGSAIIDSANTGGFKTGTNDVIVAAYYSTARSECIDFSNDGGLTFTDYTNNPVVVNNGRDPHLLWYAPSNYWVMAVYDSDLGGIKFYSTPDLRKWTYRSGVAGFYECPDLFELPVDGNTNNMLWELNDGSAGYMLGTFNGAVFTPTTAKLPGNAGSGFYASQTFTVMPPGDTRRVRMGWAQLSMPGMPFNQMMFFPTVLSLQTLAAGVRLCSAPVAEITNAIENTYAWTNLTISPGSNPLSGIRGQLFDLQAQFTPGTAQTISFVLGGVPITYTPASQQIACNGDTQTLAPLNGIVTLEIITDRQSVEIFGNSGQLYMPLASTGYTPGLNTLSLTSLGASTVFNSLTVNLLNSTWPRPGH